MQNMRGLVKMTNKKEEVCSNCEKEKATVFFTFAKVWLCDDCNDLRLKNRIGGL